MSEISEESSVSMSEREIAHEVKAIDYIHDEGEGNNGLESIEEEKSSRGGIEEEKSQMTVSPSSRQMIVGQNYSSTSKACRTEEGTSRKRKSGAIMMGSPQGSVFGQAPGPASFTI